MPDFNSIRFQSARPLLQEITAERLNAILQEIQRNKPLPGRGITTRQEGGGVRVDLAATQRGSIAAQTFGPWDLIARPDPESESETPPYLVTVQPGTLSGFLPTNWDDEFTVAATGLHYAKAVVATDGKDITSVTLEIDTTAPVPQTPTVYAVESSIDVLFGMFVEGQAFRTIPAGNMQRSPVVWFSAPRQDSLPGESQFDEYFVLQ
jgi:hypothetical protein